MVAALLALVLALGGCLGLVLVQEWQAEQGRQAGRAGGEGKAEFQLDCH